MAVWATRGGREPDRDEKRRLSKPFSASANRAIRILVPDAYSFPFRTAILYNQPWSAMRFCNGLLGCLIGTSVAVPQWAINKLSTQLRANYNFAPSRFLPARRVANHLNRTGHVPRRFLGWGLAFLLPPGEGGGIFNAKNLIFSQRRKKMPTDC